MPYVTLKLPSGVFRNGTRYEARGRWYDSHLVRFFEGTKRPWGGWLTVKNSAGVAIAPTGVTRKLLGWKNNTGGATYLAIGTHSKLYNFVQGVLNDLTPVGLTAGAVDSDYSVAAYGSGAYGAGAYGRGDLGQSVFTECGSWQLDTWGEDLVGVLNSDGRVAYYDTSAGGVAQFISASWPIAGGTGTMPTSVRALVVTPERFLFALGGVPSLDPTQPADPRLVQWPHQETVNQWTTGTAGNFPLSGNGTLMCGIRARNETLLFTDVDLFAAQYIGGTLVYAFKQVGSNCGILSRHAGVFVGGVTVWMSQRGFFMYDGYVKPLNGDVSDYIFKDFNHRQRHKVFVVPFTNFGEVVWFYPSANSQEPDRYAAWNFVEGHWAVGKLTRTAGIDRGAFDYPMLADTTAIYDHERGTDRTGAAAPFLESGPYEIAQGDRIVHVRQLVPDEATLAGQLHGSVQAKLYSAYYPTSAAAPDETTHGPFTLATPTSVRLSGRQVRVRLEEVVAGDWRVGDVRLEVVPGGLR